MHNFIHALILIFVSAALGLPVQAASMHCEVNHLKREGPLGIPRNIASVNLPAVTLEDHLVDGRNYGYIGEVAATVLGDKVTVYAGVSDSKISGMNIAHTDFPTSASAYEFEQVGKVELSNDITGELWTMLCTLDVR